MFQNLKVDIVYYKTNTDFEMEFNLCGCCRMRLLTDKAPDKKTMIHSLARAVSRSRVTIIVGTLFGDEGIISLAAGAIGSKLAKADNKTYKIASDEEIEIIDGSTPLVTPEGYFGGCIIEKGPQTMILLTENKNVRKSVMKTLIHPYIEELCALELKEKATETVENNEVIEETIPDFIPETEIAGVIEADAEIEPLEDALSEEIIAVEDEETAEEEVIDELLPEEVELGTENEAYGYLTEDDTEDVAEEDMDLVVEEEYEEIEMESSDTDIFAAEDDEYEMTDSDIIFDGRGISLKEFRRRNEAYYTEEENVDGLLAEDEDDYSNDFKSDKALNISIIVISVLLGLLLIVLCYTIFYVPSKAGFIPTAYVKDIFDTLFG